VTALTMTRPLPWLHDDGGRHGAGYRGDAGDCACRAIAIAAQLPYQQVYDLINSTARLHEKRRSRPSSAREGVWMPVMKRVMAGLGWSWTPVMGIGTGCTVHLAEGELPAGRLITRLSGHYAAVIDGTVHDMNDPGRDGTRCVYGFWALPERFPST
jgi:hypothetical protein